jgi:hypothetical protein
MVALAVLGVTLIKWIDNRMFPLRVSWRSDKLHVSSSKDGPWIVTHLVMRDTNQYAVAALPTPVAIIDSRGEYFTTNFLQSLTWIANSGETSAPPRYGQRMKAFYFVPKQTDASSR